jgi:hypothetical protein
VCLGDQTLLPKHQVQELCPGQCSAGVLIGQALLSHQYATPQGCLDSDSEVPLLAGKIIFRI